MKRYLWLPVLLLAIPLLALAQVGRSPYAGQAERPLKALSDEEIQDYLTGQGMGLAKAAELNGYPGPKHVLELAGQLQLADSQKAEAQRIRGRMLKEAKRLGGLIVEKERELDGLFAGGLIDGDRLRALTGQIARLQGELRAAHLQAHLEQRRVLTPGQIRKYDGLRGYGAGRANPHGGHEHNHE